MIGFVQSKQWKNSFGRSFAMLFVAAICIVAGANAQTTVYTNAFPGTGGTTVVPGGTPAVTFTNALGSATRSGVQLGGTDPAVFSTAFTNNQLAEWVAGPAAAPLFGTATTNSWSQTTAPLAGYSAPFNTTLSANSSSITWTFNMATGVAASGFANTQDNAVVVLAGTSATVRTAGNGYAVAFNPAAPTRIELIRYTGGLQGTVTTIISSSVALATATRYASVSVTYDPTSNTWNLYVRDDGAAAFADPAVGVLGLGGTAVDATYTGTSMTSFGFFSNHEAQTVNFLIDLSFDNYSYFDNFTVTLNCSTAPITGTGIVCTGSNLPLSDITVGGAWSSAAVGVATVSPTGVVTGMGAGTATISYTAGGCAATTVVTVVAAPTGILGTLTVCSGANTNLSDAVGGGTWLSGTTTVATIGATGIVHGVSGGTSIITYTTSGMCTTTAVVTVNTSPTAILGTPNVCVGLTTTLTDAVLGGAWSADLTGIASIGAGTGVLNGLAAGTANVTYTMPGNCFVTVVATVNPAPSAILGTPVVCQGSTTSLSNLVGGGAWTSSVGAVATIDPVTGLVTGVSGGTSTIVYTSTNCTPVSVVVTVNPVAGITGIASVCAGLTTNLADAVPGGTWTSGSPAIATIGSSSGVVSGATPGTSTIVYTTPANCTSSIVVTVNQSPVAISGTFEICAGLTTTLTDGTAGGGWTTSNANTTIGAGTGLLGGVTAGTSTITYMLPDACYSTTDVTVDPLPAAISGLASGCAGLLINLSDATPGGGWSSSAPPIATVGAASGIVNGVSPGMATITYMLPTGCISTIVVTVNPSPLAIVGSTTVCVGSNTTLTDPAIGGTWASSAPLTADVGSSSGIVSGFAAGTTTITYTLPIGGCTATMDVTVNPLPLAISGATSVCAGSTVTLSNSTAGGTWSSSNPAIATISATGTVNGIIAGVVTITYMLGTGCYVTSPMTVNPLPASITGTGYVCVGLTTTVSDLSPGGAWSSSLPTTASIVPGTGVITGVAPGVTTISYTLPTTCYITTAVTVNTPPTAISGPNTVCLGSAITLINGTVGGAWTTTAGSGSLSVSSSAGVVTGLTVGTATIYYTTFSCIPVSYSVSVNPLPAPITGMGSVCSGSSVTLSDITPGGVWTSGSASATVSSTGVVSGVTAGTIVNISYVLPTTCFVSVPIYIDSIPAAILGADSVCPGSSVVLSDVTVGGVWTSSDGTIAMSIATTGVVTGMVAGNVLISYTLISGCSISKPFHVETPVPSFLTIKSTPADSFLCSNTPDTLTAVDSNGGTPTFVWKIFGAYVGSGPTYSYNPLHADFITCIMTTSNICASPSVISADITLNVWPEAAPIIDITTAQPDTSSYLGQVYTFYSTTTFGGPSPSYQWYINNAPIGGATSAVFTTSIYNDNDTIYCVVNSNSPCDTSLTTRGSNSLIIYGQGYLSVGGVTASGNDLSLFPNPNNGSFTLSGKVNANSSKDISIEMSDMLGRAVYVGKITPVNGHVRADIKLDADIAQGTYLLRVHTETGTETFHFVISK